jgi:hypothetical protein
MGVAEGIDAETGHEIEVAVAGGVEEVNTLAAVHHDRVSSIDGKKGLRVAFQNM